MNAEGYRHWHTKFQSFLEGRYPHAALLFSLEYDEASDLIMDVPEAVDTNKWLGNQLRASLDTSAPTAELFIQNLMDAEDDERGISSSGIDIAARIHAEINERDSSMMESDWTSFQRETYLKPGMKEDAIRLAIKKIANKLRVMPKHVKDAPHATLRTIVSKMCAHTHTHKHMCTHTQAHGHIVTNRHPQSQCFRSRMHANDRRIEEGDMPTAAGAVTQ